MNINQLREGINQALLQQINKNTAVISEIDDQLIPIANSLKDYLAGGKRFRPIFSLLGFLGANGELNNSVYKAVTALEFLQASALIHDDLMDGSDTRRGKPAIHKQFGDAAAILIGDLALVWNEEALHNSGLESKEVNSIHDIMRTELMAGQFLDVYEQTQNSFSIERSLKIARYKSGKYSIERPLHFGAALAKPKNVENYYNIYSEYGLPLGEAFQLRDDLLGVFGDPSETGKPAGDDLREGKRTALVAYAHDRGDAPTKKLIETKLGTSNIDGLADAILESGAVTHVEDLIEKLSESALDAIERDEINQDAKTLLIEMVSLVTKRTR
jgi:geranylgeranyl diphosphate synthase type I